MNLITIIRYVVCGIMLIYIWWSDRSGVREAWLNLTGKHQLLAEIQKEEREDRVSEAFHSMEYLLVALYIGIGSKLFWIPIAVCFIPFLLMIYLLLVNPKEHTCIFGKWEKCPLCIKMFLIVGILFIIEVPKMYFTRRYLLLLFGIGGGILLISMVRWRKALMEGCGSFSFFTVLQLCMYGIPIMLFCLSSIASINGCFGEHLVTVTKSKVVDTDGGRWGRSIEIPQEDAVKGQWAFSNTYDFSIGDEVYIVVKQGAFGIPWREIYDEESLPKECMESQNF